MSPARARNGRGRAAALLLAALAAAAFVPSLSGAFLLDDFDHVARNEALRAASVWLRAFFDPGILTANADQAPMMYRPLTALSFALTWRLSGADPFGHHLASLLLHGLNAALVFMLARLLFAQTSPSAAWAAALLFAWHPAHAESVAYISGSRGTLLSFAFAAAAVLLHASEERARARFAPAAFAAALLCKEAAAFLILVLPAYDALWRGREDARRRLRRWLPHAAVLAAYLVVRWLVLGQTAQRGPWGDSWSAHYALAAHGLWQDLEIAFWPARLRACYSFPAGASLGTAGLARALALTAPAAAALYGLRRRSKAAFGPVWFLAALLPVSNLVPVEALAADRFLYAPLAGLALAAAWALARVPARAGMPAAAACALLLLPLTLRQQQGWRGQFELDLAARAAAPEDPCTGVNLATHYFNWGMLPRARALLADAAREDALAGIRGAARLMLGFSCLKEGRLRDGLPYLEAAALDRPEDMGLRRVVESVRGRVAARAE